MKEILNTDKRVTGKGARTCQASNSAAIDKGSLTDFMIRASKVLVGMLVLSLSAMVSGVCSVFSALENTISPAAFRAIANNNEMISRTVLNISIKLALICLVLGATTLYFAWKRLNREAGDGQGNGGRR